MMNPAYLPAPANFISISPEGKKIKDMVTGVAKTKCAILLQGETGTGKEMLALICHEQSYRSQSPFVPVNCGALPENLVESELFGHRRGAFTGAQENRRGKFELAHGGTIFLDEIGELSPQAQVKLLRVFEEKHITPVGAERPIPIDVRIIAATNRTIEDEIQKGRFREDLFYRFPLLLTVLPLRERKMDISPLIGHFLADIAKETGLEYIPSLSKEAEEIVLDYSWPGNARELRNVLEYALIIWRIRGLGGELFPEDLPEKLLRKTNGGDAITPPKGQEVQGAVMPLKEMEKQHIFRALEETDNDKRRAAVLLGVSLSTLRRKIAEYEIQAN